MSDVQQHGNDGLEASVVPAIQPNPNNWVCFTCGSAEIECIDWVRVNDNAFMGGLEPGADDYWCEKCETHEEPCQAFEFCEREGHTGNPCAVCGAP